MPVNPSSTELERSITPVHTAVPGRVRLAVRGLRRNRALAATLSAGLRADPRVREVHVNVLTGRVLLLYARETDLRVVIALVARLASAGQRPDALEDRGRHGTPSSRRARVTKTARERRSSGVMPPTSPTPAWHGEAGDAVLAALGATPRGLGPAEAAARLLRYGPNRLPPPPRRSELAMLAGQFLSLPVGLLGVSAVVSIATGGVADAAVILGVVLINAVIGFVTERQAERTITALGATAPRQTAVLRDGMVQQVAVTDIVPGDVLVLEPGAYLAADVRLLHTRNLTVDESALTGESMPVAKDERPLPRPDTPLADRRNMAYMGTLVTGGNGTGVVVGTALETELGRIQALVGEASSPQTPMQRQLDHLGTQLGVLSGLVCAGVFAIGLLRGLGWIQMLKGAVSLAVAAVPEGLPTVATTTLALGINNMRRHRVAVRRLDAVETLGAVQVFCLDKTGTLTQNRMSVVAAHVGGQSATVTGQRLWSEGRLLDLREREDVRRLLEAVSLCSETGINGDGPSQSFDGSPTEKALVELAVSAGCDVRTLRRDYPRLKLRHRAEGRPYMASLHASPDGGRLLAIKGSPAEVLEMCSEELSGSQRRPLTQERRAAILRANEHMAADALRVLGVAYAALGADESIRQHDLVWLGLVGMADPLRPGMTELMRLYHAAGIETVMITGDQGATAYAIGQELGLGDGQPIKILDSGTLDKVDPQLLTGLVRNAHVFARVSPAHKLAIVQALQRGGRVVAMTGDGINDGPALKAADIGVAMGGSGTDVARSVADVVLEDDNLHTMVVAIRQGRTIYANIRKTIHYLFATNFSEIEVMLGGIALGLGQPLNPMQLLWINLLSDIFPGLALAVEPSEPDVMARPPRDPGEPIIPRRALARMARESALITAGTLAAFAYAVMRYGPGPRASTQAFTTLTTAQLLHALACRSEQHGLFSRGRLPRNRRLELAIGASLLAQAAAGTLPPLRRLLGTTPLGPLDLGIATLGAVAPLLINEALKELSPGEADARAGAARHPSEEASTHG